MNYQSEARYIVKTALATRGRSAGIKHAHTRIKVWQEAGSRMMVEVWQGAIHFMELTKEKAPPKRAKKVKVKVKGIDNWTREPRRPSRERAAAA